MPQSEAKSHNVVVQVAAYGFMLHFVFLSGIQLTQDEIRKYTNKLDFLDWIIIDHTNNNGKTYFKQNGKMIII